MIYSRLQKIVHPNQNLVLLCTLTGAERKKVFDRRNNPKRETLERLDRKVISWEVFPTMNRVSWPQKHSKNWISLAVFLTQSSIYLGVRITSRSSHNVKVVGYLILYEIRRDLVYFPEKKRSYNRRLLYDSMLTEIISLIFNYSRRPFCLRTYTVR